MAANPRRMEDLEKIPDEYLFTLGRDILLIYDSFEDEYAVCARMIIFQRLKI